MSQLLISRNPDLKRLRDEGYDVAIVGPYLVLGHVPYVNARKEVKLGQLVSELSLAGDVTTKPGTHVIYFTGDYPCRADGAPISQIRHQSREKDLADGLVVQHSFSSKPPGGYNDHYDKMSTYAAVLSTHAEAIDPSATPRVFPAIGTDDGESIFQYIDTASSRSEITACTQKLALDSVAIVGLGGTGSYVLDLVAKTPVQAIHLFDGDGFSQHNAFRSPGAPSIDDLKAQMRKVDHFRAIYSKMHRNIIAHNLYITEDTVQHLHGMAFVFLCMDGGGDRLMVVERLEHWGTPFVDVGMGVEMVDESLLGIARVTSSTPQKRDHVWSNGRIPFTQHVADNEYSRNIQIADLNALNAALAVVKWKKYFGFYHDQEQEHFTTYTIDGNALINEDRP